MATCGIGTDYSGYLIITIGQPVRTLKKEKQPRKSTYLVSLLFKHIL